MNRNPRKRQLRALIYAFFIVSALFILPSGATANVDIVNENFDSYTTGLPPGGEWLATSTGLLITDFRRASIPNSLDWIGGGTNPGTYLPFATTTYLYASVWFYVDTFENADQISFLIKDETLTHYISVNLAKWENKLFVDDNVTRICDELSEDTWYKFEWEAWSQGYGRFQCNDLGWTATSTEGFYGYTEGDFFGAFYLFGQLNTGDVYLDDLLIQTSGTPGAPGCDQWESSDDCIAGGCYWERIMFQEEYSYCRDIATSTEGYCDYGIFDCAYCNSSSTCAGATGCFWNTIKGCTYFEQPCEFDTLENCENETDCENASGTWNGDFCFSSAVKEDCSGMSLTEGFLCQIKNFLSSMFLPSKAKLAELQQNIDLINTRFPSNYLKQSYNFLGNIRAGIASSTGITFGIMNATGTVSFSVLEHSTGTGGVATVKGVFFIFFNTILSIGFIKWALNLLSRIFK